MADESNKVTPRADEPTMTGETKDVKKESNRKDFPIKEALYKNEKGEVITAINGDGVLIAVPKPIKDDEGKVVYAGFNTRKHNPLKKGDFSDDVVYLRHQAFISRVKAAILLKSAEDKEAKANRIAQFGDEATRKKVQKMARMKESLAALTQQLKDDGVDISLI